MTIKENDKKWMMLRRIDTKHVHRWHKKLQNAQANKIGYLKNVVKAYTESD